MTDFEAAVMVLQYLEDNGFMKTAQTFKREAKSHLQDAIKVAHPPRSKPLKDLIEGYVELEVKDSLRAAAAATNPLYQSIQALLDSHSGITTASTTHLHPGWLAAAAAGGMSGGMGGGGGGSDQRNYQQIMMMMNMPSLEDLPPLPDHYLQQQHQQEPPLSSLTRDVDNDANIGRHNNNNNNNNIGSARKRAQRKGATPTKKRPKKLSYYDDDEDDNDNMQKYGKQPLNNQHQQQQNRGINMMPMNNHHNHHHHHHSLLPFDPSSSRPFSDLLNAQLDEDGLEMLITNPILQTKFATGLANQLRNRSVFAHGDDSNNNNGEGEEEFLSRDNNNNSSDPLAHVVDEAFMADLFNDPIAADVLHNLTKHDAGVVGGIEELLIQNNNVNAADEEDEREKRRRRRGQSASAMAGGKGSVIIHAASPNDTNKNNRKKKAAAGAEDDYVAAYKELERLGAVNNTVDLLHELDELGSDGDSDDDNG